MKSRYSSIVTKQNLFDSHIAKYNAAFAQKNSAACTKVLTELDSVVCKQLAPLMHPHSLPLAERYQTVRLLYTQMGCACCVNHEGAGERFRRAWIISELCVSTLVAVHGWESALVRNDLKFVVDYFSEPLNNASFVKRVLAGDKTVSNRLTEYRQRLATYSHHSHHF